MCFAGRCGFRSEALCAVKAAVNRGFCHRNNAGLRFRNFSWFPGFLIQFVFLIENSRAAIQILRRRRADDAGAAGIARAFSAGGNPSARAGGNRAAVSASAVAATASGRCRGGAGARVCAKRGRSSAPCAKNILIARWISPATTAARLSSFLIGAKRRLGWDERGGFFGRRLFYTDRVAPEKNPPHESARLARLLSGWQIPMPASLEAEIRADPALADAAKKILPHERAVVCHVASSQPKKEWPLAHWAEFCRLASLSGAGFQPARRQAETRGQETRATTAGPQIVFTTARGEREMALMTELKNILEHAGKMPAPLILPEIAELPLFLAVLARAGAFISGDTGPLHFAAGLGVPTISLFGPSSPARWAPIGARHQYLTGGSCTCDGNLFACARPQPEENCLFKISAEQVLAALKNATAI